MLWLIVFYLPFLAFGLLPDLRKGSLINPLALFVVFNTIGLIGGLLVADPGRPVDQKYVTLLFGYTVLVCIAAGVGRAEMRSRMPMMRNGRAIPTQFTFEVSALFALSIAVTIVYYYAVGHITLVEAATAGPGYDAATARLDSYAGTSYFAPGYVNQFKNAILPAMAFAYVHQLWARRRHGRLVISLAIGIGVFVAVAGTGQRGALVIVMLTVLLATLASGVLSKIRFVGLVAGIFALFSVTTLLTGRRAAEYNSASGFADRVVFFGQSLFDRVFIEQAQSGLYAFHYTEILPRAFAEDWTTDLVGILPGYRGSDLSSQVFATIYGSTRGTAPPSIWGSVYYNFGLTLSVVVALVILGGFVYATRKLYFSSAQSPRHLSALEVYALCGLAVASGSWIAGSPLTLLNQSVLAYVLTLWIARRAHRSASETNAWPERPPPDSRARASRTPLVGRR